MPFKKQKTKTTISNTVMVSCNNNDIVNGLERFLRHDDALTDTLISLYMLHVAMTMKGLEN